MHILPVDILFIIMKYIDNIQSFLEYLKDNNSTAYKDIINSFNNKINKEYQILKTIDNIYQNIETMNKNIEYMEYKNQLFNFSCNISINLSIISYKLFELYHNKLHNRCKKRFNNLCVNLRYPYIKECVNNINKYNPNVNIKNYNINLDLYLIIKEEILAN